MKILSHEVTLDSLEVNQRLTNHFKLDILKIFKYLQKKYNQQISCVVGSVVLR